MTGYGQAQSCTDLAQQSWPLWPWVPGLSCVWKTAVHSTLPPCSPWILSRLSHDVLEVLGGAHLVFMAEHCTAGFCISVVTVANHRNFWLTKADSWHEVTAGYVCGLSLMFKRLKLYTNVYTQTHTETHKRHGGGEGRKGGRGKKGLIGEVLS